MELIIISPSSPRHSQPVDKATIPGCNGPFTVLPGHAPILTNVCKGKIRFNKPGESMECNIDIEDGLVEIKKDEIRIFIEE